MEDNQNSQESFNWQDRLKHLDSSTVEESPPAEDFVEIHDQESGVENKQVLPEGVSLNKSRGTGDDAVPGPSIADRVFSAVGFKKQEEESKETSGEQREEKPKPSNPLETDPGLVKQQFNGLKCPIAELTGKVSTEALLADYRKKKRMIWIGIAVVLVGAVGAYSSLAFPSSGGELGYWMRRIFLLPFPICLALASIEFAQKTAGNHPVFARRLLGFFSFISSVAKRFVATMEEDMGEYEKAEKRLLNAVKSINRTKDPRGYITTYAYLSSVRANTGKVVDAEKHILQLLVQAKKYYDTRPNDVNGTMLATVLVHAARISNWLDKPDDSLRLYETALDILCNLEKPPADLLASTLAMAGHQYNVAGKYDEALIVLSKSEEVNREMPDGRLSTKAMLSANLGLAYLGKEDTERAAAFFKEAEKIANNPMALSELSTVHKARAQMHVSTGFKEAADHEYQKCIYALEQLKPAESFRLVRALRDYAEFLKSVGRVDEAEQNINRSTQIKYNLDRANYQNEPVVKDQIKQVEIPTLKARFPVVWILVAVFFTWDVINSGLRIAGTFAWLWSIGPITIVAMKLFAKYGKHADQESSQGAVLAVVSAIPLARHLVPELSVLPKRTTSIVLGCALAALALVNFTRPAPHTVPESGLLSYEYAVLARNLASEGDLVNAKKAAAKAKNPDISGNYTELMQKIEKYNFPKNPQPDEALIAYNKAMKGDTEGRLKRLKEKVKEKKSKKKSKNEPGKTEVALRKLIEKYPDFALPYASLAQELVLKNQYEEADQLMQKAFEINPDNNTVLLAGYLVASKQKHRKESKKYFNKLRKNVDDIGGPEAAAFGLMAGAIDSLEDMEDDLEKKVKEKKKKQKNAKKNDSAVESSESVSKEVESADPDSKEKAPAESKSETKSSTVK